MTFSLFLISGIFHQLTNWHLDLSCGDYADLQFFCMNAVAVYLESAVSSCSRIRIHNDLNIKIIT